METDVKQVTMLCKKLTGHEVCHQLVSRLCRDLSFDNLQFLADTWANREDTVLELPWGNYYGNASIRRCLLEESPIKNRIGIMDVHCAITECLEIAEDALTARGCWMFQSITTQSTGEAHWVWYKADICFTVENDNWKFWRMTIYPMFDADFDEDWGNLQPTDWSKVSAGRHPDAPAAQKPWHLGDPIRLWECYPPKPYQTWNETVLGREPK